MSYLKRILSDIRTLELIYPICGGIALTVLGFITLMSCGCHPIYDWILLPRAALPYWIFALLGILMFFMMGACIGLLFAVSRCRNRVYTAVLLLAASVILTMIWYHVLFSVFNTFLSLLILLSAIATELLFIGKTIYYNTLASVSIIPVLIIQIHFIWLNIGIRFLN